VFFNHLFHHCFELVKIDFLVTIFVDFFDDLGQLFTSFAIFGALEEFLKLLSTDLPISVNIEEVKNFPDIHVGAQILFVASGCQEFIVVD
jgi:hypothetical protein